MSPDDTRNDSSETHRPSNVHRATVDEELGATLSIVEELAALTATPPTELEPLYDDVDTENLDWLVSGADENKLNFESNGFAVTVYGDGTLVFTRTGN